MEDAKFKEEYDRIWEEGKKKISEIFEKYDAMPSQGLDKEGEQIELREVWREIDLRIKKAKEKYNVE